MNSRRADAVFFGFDFQVNAAIILMLENIRNLQSLRLESEYEDIDIVLDNGKHILAQAKSVRNSSSDFHNVRKNLESSLQTLSEGAKDNDIEALILITNSPNPLKDEASRSIFWGHSHREFSTLPESSREIINDCLSRINNPLNTELFSIQVVPFETDNDSERYKTVLQVINDFIGTLNLEIPGLGKNLHQVWCGEIFKNGSKNAVSITLTKKSIVWPIIVISTDVERMGNDFMERFDSVQYDEILRHYRETIDCCCEKVEFFTKILFDFSSYDGTESSKDRSLSFTSDCWQNYSSEFETDAIDPETLEALTKVVIYNVIRRRYDINRIKKGVDLL